MTRHWKWFFGGGACGFLVGGGALLVVFFGTMYIPWDLEYADKLYDKELTWRRTELDHGGWLMEQVDADGQRNGEMRLWAKGGRQTGEGRYYNDARDGHWVLWDPEGQWWATGGHDAGGMHGTWIFWDAVSSLGEPVELAVVSYGHGKKHGPLTAWREDGSLVPDVTGWYEDDVRVRDLEPHELHRRPGG